MNLKLFIKFTIVDLHFFYKIFIKYIGESYEGQTESHLDAF